MEDVLDNEQDIFRDSAFRMTSRPTMNKQFESLGSDFAHNRKKIDTNDKKKAVDRREAPARYVNAANCNGGRESTKAKAKWDSDLDLTDSDDELDTLSRRSETPSQEETLSSQYAKQSATLKTLKFKKKSASTSESTSTSQPTKSASNPLSSVRQNRDKGPILHSSKAAGRFPMDTGSRTGSSSSTTRDVSTKRKVSDNNNIGIPQPERPRPKPRPIQRPPEVASKDTQSSGLSRQPSSFPMDRMAPLIDREPIKPAKQPFPVSPLSTPIAMKKRVPQDFPTLSPLDSGLAPSSSVASFPPSSPPEARPSTKRVKSSKGVSTRASGTRRVISSDESDSSSESVMKAQPFPMSSQDLASIRHSPGSPSKRPSPDNHRAGEGKKRREDSPPRLESPWFEEDTVIMDTSLLLADPKTLCPYCDAPLPSSPTPLLQYLLSPEYTPLFAKSRPEVRPGNKLGRTGPLSAFIPVCQRHKFESDVLPEAEAKGWPKEINWKRLGKRVKEMKTNIQKLLGDDPKHRERCLFWTDIMQEMRDKGSRAVTGVTGQIQNFKKIQPGYYGEQGSNIIHQVLFSLFPPSEINQQAVAPLTPNDFISRILVPEVAATLIMQDQHLSDKALAVKVLRESSAYGVAMFPEDGGDWAQVEDARLSGKSFTGASSKKSGSSSKGGRASKADQSLELGVADMIVMERARKRRLEVEEEMRIEDEMLDRQRKERSKERSALISEQSEQSDAQSTSSKSKKDTGRPKPIPLARKSKNPPSRSVSRSGTTASSQSESEYIDSRPRRSSRRPASVVSKELSPSVSDYDRASSQKPSGKSARPLRNVLYTDTIELSLSDSDGSTRKQSTTRQSRSKTKSSRASTPDKHVSPRARSTSTTASRDRPVDGTSKSLRTPKPSRSRPSYLDDDHDTPRPSGVAQKGKSGSALPSLPVGKQHHDDPSKRRPREPPWLTSMAHDDDDDDDDDAMIVDDSDNHPYGGRLAHDSSARKGLKKKGSNSWLLSESDGSDH